MPRKQASPDPSFESLRKACNAENGYTTRLELSIGSISCRFGLRRKSARMDIDLSPTSFNIVPDRWREFAKRHEEYVQATFARSDWKDVSAQVRPDGLCLDVLREDAEEWFEFVRSRLDGPEGMTGVSPLTRRRGW